LLLDHGPDNEGPRWQSSSETFHDLETVLACVADDPAIVVLGPPGAGKSTLLRYCCSMP
jgi:ABC-type cobalamin/Fe3+-siderophores transport system ATPase subunit